MTVRILFADDQADFLQEAIDVSAEDFTADTAHDPGTVLEKVRAGAFDVIILDDNFGEGKPRGTTLIPEIRKASPSTAILLHCARSLTMRGLTDAKAAGADDYAAKGKTSIKALLKQIKELLGFETQEKEDLEKGRQLAAHVKAVYRSKAMEAVFKDVARYREESVHVLIQGPTGAGKELVANAFRRHETSRPFIPVNCAAVPKDLVSSEFFGHERGSFTGASAQKRGLFEEADGGDLFLDEVHCLSEAAQKTLLRAIESQEILRVGSTQTRKVRVRIIAATSEDLTDLARQGHFLVELLGRIKGAQINLPPLRERREDIIPIFHQALKAAGRADVVVAPDVEEFLEELPWPTNARQVRMVAHRLLPLVTKGLITARHISPELIAELRDDVRSGRPGGGDSGALVIDLPSDVKVDDAFRTVMQRLVEEGKKTLGSRVTQKAMAEKLGVSRSTFQGYLKAYEISDFSRV